jgi:hypothetical protein
MTIIDATATVRHEGDGTIVLQPQPSSDPNDPLVLHASTHSASYCLSSFIELVQMAKIPQLLPYLLLCNDDIYLVSTPAWVITPAEAFIASM